jgi:Ca2+-binding EF-hand superfamily protein
MNKFRQDLILKAFQKLDKNGDGVVTVDDLYHVYSAEKHPKYLVGEWTEKKCFEEWLKIFDSPSNPDATITYDEFTNYYSGVSAS